MRCKILFLLLMLSGGLLAQKSGSSHVISHNRKTIVTDPSKGEHSYKAWAVFPAQDASVRRIKLLLTLGSPDEMPTAHWDYCDVISIRRTGGVYGTDKQVEIGRMLTPYGSIFGKGWQWLWEVDVTDFQQLLRDSVEIEYMHAGYEPNTVGWALTLDFAFDFGPPIAKPLGMVALWNDKFKYGDSANPIDKSILPLSVNAPAGASFSRMRIQHTGHGADRPRNCSEFCSRWRAIYADGKLVDKRDMWKECSTNPLYPQGGTWIYDRAYWCPGDLQIPDIFNIPMTPGKHQVSMVMEPYTATANVQAYEHIGSYLFYYGKPMASYDVALEDIISPSTKQAFTRHNPAVANPKIVVRNLGSQPLKQLDIRYGMVGGEMKTYKWKGELPFYGTAEISLPGAIAWPAKDNNFVVELLKPNGKADAWAADNTLKVACKAPVILPAQFVVKYKTNNNPGDNNIRVQNADGETFFARLSDQSEANAIYLDTVTLQEGYHQMELTDSSGNGLQFWAQPRQGEGYLRLYDMQGRLFHVFESDCGAGESLGFLASKNYMPDTINIKSAFSMYPRRTKDKVELGIELSQKAKVTVKITVDGILHQLHEYASISNGDFTYSLITLPRGRFVVDVYVNDVRHFTGRVNLEQ